MLVLIQLQSLLAAASFGVQASVEDAIGYVFYGSAKQGRQF